MIAPELEQELTAIAAQLRQVTVQIQEHRHGMGSGVIWHSDGVIVTNAHVVRGTSTQVELFDGRKLAATVVHRNPQRDLAILQVNAPDLPAAIVGSGPVRMGEIVLAMGNPLGQTGVLTTGIIHTLGSNQFSQQNWIQADIALAPGNSGGPLANARGEVIGINTMIVHGRGFAIPSRIVQQVLDAPEHRPRLGISIQLVRVPLRHRRASLGLLITAVEPSSPAAIARLQPGDVLIGVRGSLFRHPGELFHILENSKIGDSVSLDVWRSHTQLVVTVVLCNQDSQTQVA